MKLVATNMKLVATNMKLVTTNMKLVTTNMKLVTTNMKLVTTTSTQTSALLTHFCNLEDLVFLISICGLPVWYRPTKRITPERAGLRGSHCFIPVLLFSHAVYELSIVGSRSQHRTIPTVASRHLQHRDQLASGDCPMSADGD